MLWQIGDWVADNDTDTLANGDVRRKVERRAMDVLLYLAERQGQVVTKDDLIGAVWERVAVSDHAIAMVVSQLRQALGDDARTPHYIETITKRGYRLIAPAAKVSAAPAASLVEQIEPVSEAPAKRGPQRSIVALFGLVAAAVVTIAIFARPTPAPVAGRILLMTDFQNIGVPETNYLATGLNELVGESLQRLDGGDVIRWDERGVVKVADVHRLFGPQQILVVSARMHTETGKTVAAVSIRSGDELKVTWRSSYTLDEMSIDANALRISRDLAAAMGNAKFSEDPQRRSYPAEAQAAYWRAYNARFVDDTETVKKARDILTQLVKDYPDYAPGHALLANIYAQNTGEEFGEPTFDTLAEARSHLAEAKRLAPATSMTESVEANLAFFGSHDVPAAIDHAQRAIRYSTGHGRLWRDLAEYLAFAGRSDDAIAAIDRAYRLDLAHPGLLWMRAWVLYVGGRYQEARLAADEAAKVSPAGYVYDAFIFEALGRDREAIDAWIEYARGRDLKPELVAEAKAAVRAASSTAAAYKSLLDVVGRAHGLGLSGVTRALIAAKAGDKEAAVNLILKDRELRNSVWLVWIDRIPPLRSLLSDPHLKPLADELRLMRSSARAHPGQVTAGP